MAKVSGNMKISGSIGTLTFVNTKEGRYVKMKGSVSRHQLKTAPSFVRTRENNEEFSTAAKGGRLLRTAFKEMAQSRDSHMSNRLHQLMMKCLQEDANPRGQRKIETGNLGLLRNFDFNKPYSICDILNAQIGCTITRPTGTVEIVVSSFTPKVALKAPGAATHYKLITSTAAIDFAGDTYESDHSESAYLPISNIASAPLSLTTSITPNITLPIIQALAICFYQEQNGKPHHLPSYDTVSIINVNTENG